MCGVCVCVSKGGLERIKEIRASCFLHCICCWEYAGNVKGTVVEKR